MPAERRFMDKKAELNEQVDYLADPRKTLEILAGLSRNAGMHPEQSDNLAKMLKVVSEVTHQIDTQKQNDLQASEVSSKAA